MDSKIEDHRLTRFLELGFDTEQSFDLLWARGLDGFHLSHHDVRKYLAAGATCEQIVRIFAPMA